MHRAHTEVRHAVLHSLEAYLRAVGPRALSLYAAEEEWRALDDAGWEYTRRELLDERLALVSLADTAASGNQYRFEYCGRPIGDASLRRWPGAVSAVSFWLPTEYLEAHGPERVRTLALELAAPLPFCSGHAGLSFNGELDMLGVGREIQERCFRYPGLDIPRLERHSWRIGSRVRGPSWLTFLGQPVLGHLGGALGLRSRLHSEGTTVEDLAAARAIVTLGLWPEAGDTENGQVLPAYRELARVLEPWLYHDEPIPDSSAAEQTRRWERRFLD
jgi:hypothetical protein